MTRRACPLSTAPAARAAGFTLLELLLVAAVMAAALALVGGAVAGALPGQQLREASGRIAAELRATRARALATGAHQAFVIDPATRRWQSGPVDAAPRRQGELPAALRVAATVAREAQPGPGQAAILFFADGSSTGGRIVLSRDGAAWRIEVGWLIGSVRVERGEGAP